MFCQISATHFHTCNALTTAVMLMKTRWYFHPPDEELVWVLLCATGDSLICLCRWASLHARRCLFKILVWEEAQAWEKVQWSHQIRSEKTPTSRLMTNKCGGDAWSEQTTCRKKKTTTPLNLSIQPYLLFSYQNLRQGPECSENSNETAIKAEG